MIDSSELYMKILEQINTQLLKSLDSLFDTDPISDQIGRYGKGLGPDLILEDNFDLTLNLDIEKYTKETDEFVAALKTPLSEI